MKTKRLCSVLIALVLVCALLPVSVFAASANFSLSGSGSVTVGSQVKVTVKLSSSEKIGSWRFSVSYDPAKLEYVSGADSGGGGAVSFADSSDGTTSVSKTITFRARKIGSVSVSVSNAQVVSFDSATNMTVNAASKTINIVAAPELSAENQLSELSVSAGELTPAFSAGTTSYTLSVPYETTSVSVYATAKHEKATVSVTPLESLAVGENKIEIAVTAENGSVKTYTITVTREESELAGVTVDLDGTTYDVAYDPASLEVPEGYLATTALYGENEILVFSAPQNTLQIAYLIAEEESAWYIYDPEEQSFSEFRLVSGSANAIVLLSPSENVKIPDGFLPYGLEVGEETWSVYKTDNSEQDGIWLVYGMNAEGDCGFYYYDETLATFASYFEPVVDKTAEEEAIKDATAYKSLYEDSENKADRMEIFFLAAAAGAILFLIAWVVTMIVAKKKNGKLKKAAVPSAPAIAVQEPVPFVPQNVFPQPAPLPAQHEPLAPAAPQEIQKVTEPPMAPQESSESKAMSMPPMAPQETHEATTSQLHPEMLTQPNMPSQAPEASSEQGTTASHVQGHVAGLAPKRRARRTLEAVPENDDPAPTTQLIPEDRPVHFQAEDNDPPVLR